MKMAVRILWFKQLLLAFMCLALLGGCGGSDESDLTAPSLTLDALRSTTFERKRDLKGSVEAGADVVVTVNTTAKVGAVTVKDGIWSCEISDLAVGSNIVTVRAADAEGNSNSLQFILVYDILKFDQVDTVTLETDPTLFGRVASGADITSVILNGTALNPIPVTMSGDDFTLELTGLTVGNNTVVITVEDASDVPLTQTISQTIFQDDGVVSLTVAMPTITSELHEVTLTGTVEDGGEVSVEVSPEATEGEDSDPSTTSWSVKISDLEEGDNFITVSAALTGKTTAETWIRVTISSLPTVVSTVPVHLADEVSPDAVVTATFSEAVVGTTVDETTFLLVEDAGGTPVAGTVSYSAADRTATFTPNAPLASGSYTATIDGVQDPDENAVSHSWTFDVL
jgi:cyclophilin family peptidyl-prolyl cis-trans isomerase